MVLLSGMQICLHCVVVVAQIRLTSIVGERKESDGAAPPDDEQAGQSGECPSSGEGGEFGEKVAGVCIRSAIGSLSCFISCKRLGSCTAWSEAIGMLRF